MISADVRRLLWVRALRAFGDGYVSLLLPVYLLALGLSPFEVGVITTGTLLGSGALTLAVGLHAHRYRYRTLLLAATALMTATGLGFAAITQFWPLLVVAFVGTLNPSSGDVSVFLPLEQAVLARIVSDKQRTAVFARYSLAGALVGAAGALFAGVPEWLAAAFGTSMQSAIKSMFVLYALIGVASALVYRKLPAGLATESEAPAAPLHRSKRIVYVLAALFSLDAFGGGFIVQSMLALWLFEKFQLSTAIAGTIFFWTGVLSAFSYLVAVRIANRIGLVNTMVFTHLPSSLLLVLMPFVPDLGWVIVAATGAQRAVADGRADAELVCDGGRLAGRARCRREHHFGAAEPRLGDEPAARRLPARAVELRLAAGDRRRNQDRLRPAAARHLSKSQAAGRATPAAFVTR